MTGPRTPEPLGKWGPSSKCWQDPDVDTEWFFPRSYGKPREPSEHVQEVKAYCHDCPVRNACLEHAVATYDDHGMWGGMTPDERRELRKAARRQPKPITHGTKKGFDAHERRGEKPCDPCRIAKNADARQQYAKRKASA